MKNTGAHRESTVPACALLRVKFSKERLSNVSNGGKAAAVV